ncbi:ABC transporter permease subunit [Clostridium tyrobutyricum]|jgi:ABC-2 type transport system permease protein|uniref:Putative transporter, trans-membrane domain bacteriocin immunity protein n=1 Tax=Clostridium tyrobutyricum DIVETGP TaxID=1408889 RepID=W6NB33_CLOTY|nr:ABC transporter permease [Clostridium tyrobutyricum]AND84655.1 hypothetical protein CTK_C13940 [Clostridium tyrobutyricum]ANP70867.1 multidrug ABC transporter permease [Clostridium tyrobutyricum]MBV4432377.1 ABC transporter permease [Clostridium tyrobutyricum]MBV4433348.1 ABC transporter permease [Clostridium tyrobutyricum]MBV4448205.1 ABC transporter permease [Clostridium tyrobutyricum]
MFIKVFVTEWKKLNRSMIWLAVIIVPVLAAFMGSFNYVQNASILKDKWYDLWTQLCLFYAYFFLPCLIGIYCSYICRLEHLNHNWNLVMTQPVSISYIFLGKLSAASGLTFITQVFMGILYLISGKFTGINTGIPHDIFLWLILGWIASIVISALQLCISIIVKNFAAPVGVAFAGGIFGLLMLAKGYGVFFPFSLLSFAMNSSHPQNALTSGNIVETLISCAVFLTIFCWFGILNLKRSEL